jgi:tRNA threonylcarbamoyladenosine modification (KEOPS) complex  Pcc1 subunit
MRLMKAGATVRLPFSSKKKLETLMEALIPEANLSFTKRTKAEIAEEGTFLVVNIEAADSVALRATLNAFLRWISSTVNVLEAAEDES